MFIRFEHTVAFGHKQLAAGNEAVGVWVRSVCWSGGDLTDGHIPELLAEALCGSRKALDRVAARLVAAGLWEVDRERGGWVAHDYLDYQPTRQQVLDRRQADRERKAEARAKAGRGSDGRYVSARNPRGHTADSARNPTGVPPETVRSPPYTIPSHLNKSSSVTRAVPAEGAEEDDSTPSALTEAAAEVAERRLRHQPAGTVRSPSRWLKRVAEAALAELRAVDGWEAMTAEQLADSIEPRPPNPHPPPYERPDDGQPTDPTIARNGLKAARAAKGGHPE